jgi:hypothetical protein
MKLSSILNKNILREHNKYSDPILSAGVRWFWLKNVLAILVLGLIVAALDALVLFGMIDNSLDNNLISGAVAALIALIISGVNGGSFAYFLKTKFDRTRRFSIVKHDSNQALLLVLITGVATIYLSLNFFQFSKNITESAYEVRFVDLELIKEKYDQKYEAVAAEHNQIIEDLKYSINTMSQNKVVENGMLRTNWNSQEGINAVAKSELPKATLNKKIALEQVENEREYALMEARQKNDKTELKRDRTSVKNGLIFTGVNIGLVLLRLLLIYGGTKFFTQARVLVYGFPDPTINKTKVPKVLPKVEEPDFRSSKEPEESLPKPSGAVYDRHSGGEYKRTKEPEEARYEHLRLPRDPVSIDDDKQASLLWSDNGEPFIRYHKQNGEYKDYFKAGILNKHKKTYLSGHEDYWNRIQEENKDLSKPFAERQANIQRWTKSMENYKLEALKWHNYSLILLGAQTGLDNVKIA